MESLKEKSVQAALELYYADKGYVVKREVHTPVGYIDFMLYRSVGFTNGEKILIEVKEHKGIKHAIGQLLSYKKYHSDITEARIVYFTRDGIYKPIHHSFLTENISFQCVHTFLPIEELYKWQRRVKEEKVQHQESMKSSKISLKEMISPATILGDNSYQTEMNTDISLPLTMENILTHYEKDLEKLKW